MSAAAEIQPMFFDEDGGDDLEIQFDPRQFEAVTPYSEDLNDEYQQAQDQLRQLRQQEEQIRRQAEELEELTQKEAQFKEGRAAATRQLTKYLSILDEEATEAQRLAEECGAAHERLESHLSHINALRPETWSRADRKAEIARALSYVEAAEEELDDVTSLVNSFGKKSSGLFQLKSHHRRPASSGGMSHQQDFGYWLKSGLAFSLPLVGFALIALIVVLFF